MTVCGALTVEEIFGCSADSDNNSKRSFRHKQWAADDYQIAMRHILPIVDSCANDCVLRHEDNNLFNESSTGSICKSCTGSRQADSEREEHNEQGRLEGLFDGAKYDTKVSTLGQDVAPGVLIPKVIHFIWLGSKRLPRYPHLENDAFAEFKDENENSQQEWNETMASWKKHHPDWDIKLWNDESISKLFQQESESNLPLQQREQQRQDLMQIFQNAIKTLNYGMASDIARLYILHQHGGLYADIDYYCIESVQDLHEQYGFYCGASNTGCIEFNNGLIGCTAGHPFVHGLMEQICTWHHRHCEKQHVNNDFIVDTASGDASFVSMSAVLSGFLDEGTQASLDQAKVTRSYTPLEVIANTGPGLLTRSLLRLFRDDGDEHGNGKNIGGEDGGPFRGFVASTNFGLLPSRVFHPVPNFHRRLGIVAGQSSASSSDCDVEGEVYNILGMYIQPGKTKAVHLWSCSWQ